MNEIHKDSDKGNKIEIKMYNTIFECSICHENYDCKKQTARVVRRFIGLSPAKQQVAAVDSYDAVFTPSPVCIECFDELDLEDKAPSAEVEKI